MQDPLNTHSAQAFQTYSQLHSFQVPLPQGATNLHIDSLQAARNASSHWSSSVSSCSLQKDISQPSLGHLRSASIFPFLRDLCGRSPTTGRMHFLHPQVEPIGLRCALCSPRSGWRAVQSNFTVATSTIGFAVSTTHLGASSQGLQKLASAKVPGDSRRG